MPSVENDVFKNKEKYELRQEKESMDPADHHGG